MAKETFCTKLASGIGSTSLICAALSGHGSAGLLIAGLAVAMMSLVRIVAPDLFWLIALKMAIRERDRTLARLGRGDAEVRRQILARDPVAEIARARGRGDKAS